MRAGLRGLGLRVATTGKATRYSDLDLAINSDTPLSLATLADLTAAFDESDFAFKVDVVDWVTTRGFFREIIRKTALVIQQSHL